jgi:predicted helicase
MEINKILKEINNHCKNDREKGTYFEQLVIQYFKNEPKYKDLYKEVLTYKEWAIKNNFNATDAGIDLVATTKTNENHAIQCKFYDENHTIHKSDIDSFFTASGKKEFSYRIIIATTNKFSRNAEEALENQSTPVQKIDLFDLENSVIDWQEFFKKQEIIFKPKKQLREHQKTAVSDVEKGFLNTNRGKLIMACGTGKTFTSLKIAEKIVGKSGKVLFLAPSLSLLSQSLTEWTQESEINLHSFAVCSDSDVGKKKDENDDFVSNIIHELKYPATTNSKALSYHFNLRNDDQAMNVIFSTYHSIDVISKSQKNYNLPEFDLIICDEAHRTTGATFDGEDESHFVKVHNNDFIKAKKRLYMTATPRIYGEPAKAKSIQENVELASMDDKGKFGEVFYSISFSEAVRLKLLVDYKVIVLSVDENYISERLGSLLKDENNQLNVDDLAKIVGCWKALSKQGTIEEESDNYQAMKRAVAFAQIIEPTKKTKGKKTASKEIAKMFEKVVEAFKEGEEKDLKEEEKNLPSKKLICKANHIDGGMNATEKQEKIDWLKEESPEENGGNICKILSNVRCLSEGVDVPSLDAVLFLTPKNSQIDVVQSVGRVMRNSPGKKMGYVILPIVIPSHLKPHEALNDNKIYATVWQVLNALRSHDDSFDSMINKANLIGLDKHKIEIVAITNKVNKKLDKKAQQQLEKQNLGKSRSIGVKNQDNYEPDPQGDLFKIEVGDLEKALIAKMVEKCGNRFYWESWANDIAEIANRHINRIKQILDNPENTSEIKAFNEFLDEIHDDLNDSISKEDAIEMLAQHLITKPVFESLFADYEFAKNNPVSKAMQKINDELGKHHLEKEVRHLNSFYESVKMRVKDLEKNDIARQKIIVELYDKFFRNAFPRMTEKLGIVYTPVEVVDFIIHSVSDVLKAEFNQEFGDKNIHILDPFTGTGTFITRLLQSGLIEKEKLPYKFQNEIHANEIVLLAYYIAAINIESTFHQITGENYQPFNGICLTDTFSLFTKEDLVSNVLVDNSKRRKRQKELDIRIIIGNPPYSAGQASENNNAKNVSYPKLDERIKETYTKYSKATSTKNLIDSYIRSFRFASDRIKDAGVIGFVSGNGFIEKSGMDGLRKCFKDEFSKIYIFNLRGDIRKNMLSKGKAKEGQNVFGSGSMTGIAISILIKNPESSDQGKIYYCDIGDDLKTEEKLAKVVNLKSITRIKIPSLRGAAGDTAMQTMPQTKSGLPRFARNDDVGIFVNKNEGDVFWQEITPDAHNDWINQRDNSFEQFLSMGDKKDKNSTTIFRNYSLGINSNRDNWVYNFSKEELVKNMQSTIAFYNFELKRFESEKLKNSHINSEKFVSNDEAKIKWSSSLRADFDRRKKAAFCEQKIITAIYRPFIKEWLYFDGMFNHRVGQMPQIFPNEKVNNLVICVSGIGARSGFSVLIANSITDLQFQDNGQCFPLYLYEKNINSNQDKNTPSLFETDTKNLNQENQEYKRTDAITDEALAIFTKQYQDQPNFKKFSKEDLFYYIYGLLHCEEYRQKYADNLSKELPRIPAVKNFADFVKFMESGRKLAKIHLNYENQEKYPIKIEYSGKEISNLSQISPQDLRVEKMKFAKNGKETDKSTIIYNNKITLKNIPLKGFNYIVNGKSAIEWVVDRQCVSINKDSKIENDANDFAINTMQNPAYIIELLQSVITLSLETVDVVNNLPKFEI